MAKALVIVESPAKAGTITKFLGSGYTVKASMGHVRDLPKNKIGVDEKTFKPVYQVLPGRKKVIDEIKKSAAKADAIYLAPDPDREGEAICWHLAQELKGAKKKIYRVMFNEITKRAILHAMEHPGVIDQNKVDAQQARRILDRLVGYKISPLLWEKVRRGLSAGRVQSVALRMIVERERERVAFKPEEYWSLTAKLQAAAPPPFEAKLTRRDDKKFEVHTRAVMDEVLGELKGVSYTVKSVVAKEKRKHAVPPFITSKLQQEAFRRFSFTVKKTMMLAQRLYEGMDVGERGTLGLITYMRTDSTRVAAEALEQVREHIGERYGREYVPGKPNVYAARKQAQEAHEAIRPTSLELTPESVKKHLSKDEFNLYLLIWNRFVASQMESAVFDTTTADIEAGRYTFRATGAVMKFPGWLAVYQADEASRRKDRGAEAEPEEAERPGRDSEGGDGAGEGEETSLDEAQATGLLPPLSEGQTLELLKLEEAQHFTQPPPRFTEAMLVKALEENGIGRPSTYASILSTIQNREYVEKEKGRFKPSELGMLVTDLLVESFPDIVEVGYTAELEEDLDKIEEGTIGWVELLKKFNTKFKKDLKLAEKEMRNVKTEEIPTEHSCSKCGKPMVVKWGRYGKFLACTGYPECRNTAELKEGTGQEGGEGAEPAPASMHEEACEKCGKTMVVRRGRFGQFLACTGYPACKNTRRIQINAAGEVTSKKDRLLEEPCPQCGKPLAVKHGRFGEFTACSNYPECRYIKLKEVGVSCPMDAGTVVERRSRRGKTFYGCNNYPDCDFVVWYHPVPRPCPQCGSTFLLEKKTKKEGEMLVCHKEDCDYKVPAETVSA
ncbi:MAG TPA: type I DNA topoisomerase [Candidatus Polarisedimenticolia bacterium]|nr:type I DNA topoisomerase [Candidatus Polarisedimenticolia bacterium]